VIFLKTRDEIEIMDEANQIIHKVLDVLERHLEPGASTLELDKIAESITVKEGAAPAFKNYHGYPASLCVSINDEVVHGIPNASRKIKDGDIVSVDFGVLFKGYYGDAARTFPVGSVDERALKLLEVTKESLKKGIDQARGGNRISDIAKAVEDYVLSNGFSVVKDYVGHGIGRNLHEEPQVPNFYKNDGGYPIKAGMVLAIEPMVNAGCSDVTVDSDGWTVRTRDGANSAHFEYSVAVTEEGPRVLGVRN
jgi:methionyl aminopeptidase